MMLTGNTGNMVGKKHDKIHTCIVVLPTDKQAAEGKKNIIIICTRFLVHTYSHYRQNWTIFSKAIKVNFRSQTKYFCFQWHCVLITSIRTVYIILHCLHSLTLAGKTISTVTLIAFTPVAHGTSRRAHVRCDWSTGGVLMTYTRCIWCTGPWVWLHFY